MMFEDALNQVELVTITKKVYERLLESEKQKQVEEAKKPDVPVINIEVSGAPGSGYTTILQLLKNYMSSHHSLNAVIEAEPYYGIDTFTPNEAQILQQVDMIRKVGVKIVLTPKQKKRGE